MGQAPTIFTCAYATARQTRRHRRSVLLLLLLLLYGFVLKTGTSFYAHTLTYARACATYTHTHKGRVCTTSDILFRYLFFA